MFYDLFKYIGYYVLFFIIIHIIIFLYTFIKINDKKSINFLNKFIENSRYIIIVFSVLMLILIYWFPPVHLYESMRFNKEVPQAGISVIMTEQQSEMLNKEFDKVIDEIKENSTDTKTWFYYKLVLVGSLIGAIIYRVVKDLKKNDIQYISIVKVRAFPITIGIAFIIALIIDIRVKQNMIVSNQLGNWLAYQYEPVMKYCYLANEDSITKYKEIERFKNSSLSIFNNLIKSDTCKQLDSMAFAKFLDTTHFYQMKTLFLHDDRMNFYTWEIFLRIENKDTKIDESDEEILTKIDSIKQVKREGNPLNDRMIGLRKLKQEYKNIENRDIEIYLRNKYKFSDSQHTDIFYSLAHFPAFHLLSWLLYFVFLCSFYFTIHNMERKDKNQWVMLTLILITVHITIVIFAILSRAQTGIFAMQYSLFSQGEYTIPSYSGIFNIFLVVWLCIPNAIYYYYSYLRIKSK